MNYFTLKLALAGLGIAFMSTPSTAQAQNLTRKGAVAGAIIGAIAGAQNDRALGGAVIGGVVGGVAGRAIDNRYGYGSGYRGYGYSPAPVYYGNPYRYQRTYVPVQPRLPVVVLLRRLQSTLLRRSKRLLSPSRGW